jgi:hypothetical protein
MRARKLMRFVTVLVMACAIPFASCHDAAPSDDLPFLPCEGKCDGDSNLAISSRWVPRDGFVRATVAQGASLEVSPADGVTIQSAGSRNRVVQFAREGFYTLKAVADGRSLKELLIRVSDESPEAVVLTPTPGSFAPLATSFTVTGRVHDPLGAPKRASVGGIPVTLGSDGGFTATTPARFGVNVLVVKVVDRADNVFTSNFALLAAERYTRDAQRSAVRLDQAALAALAAQLGPLLPLVVRIPTSSAVVASKLGNDLYIDRIRLPGQDGNPGSMSVTLESRDGSAYLRVVSTGDLRVDGRLDWLIGGVSNYVARLSRPRFEMTASFTMTAAGPEVQVLSLDIGDSGVDVEMTSMPDWFINLFSESIKNRLMDSARAKLPVLLRDSLKSLQGRKDVTVTALDRTLDLGLSYRLADVTPTAQRLAVGLVLDVDAGGTETATPGSPVLGAPPAVPVLGAGSFAAEVGYDQLNRHLYELWRGGVLAVAFNEGDLSAALARVPSVERLHPTLDVLADLGLPPVAEPDGAGGVRLSAGDLHVQLFLGTDLFQVTVEANVALRVGLVIAIENQELVVRPTLEEIKVDIGRKAFSGLNTETVEDLLVEMAPALAEQLAGRLRTFPVPRFDLATLGLPSMFLGLDQATLTAGDRSFALSGELALQQ